MHRAVHRSPEPLIELASPFQIGEVEIASRVVLAPMAGVSVQAFRRQGRRFGAGLVCSEMVSACGLSYGNARTLGYLRIARDEHPLAVQVFGSDPATVAEAARMCEAAGADIIDINFGCPVRKVTKTGAGASALDNHEIAIAITRAVADAVAVPVTVKLRRGVRNGSRDCLVLGPKLVDAGAQAITLHPRSAQQMYTGRADHGLTAELVELVDVPVMASGDITTARPRPGGARRDRRERRDDRARRPGRPLAAGRARRRRAPRAERRRARRTSSSASCARSRAR